MKFILNYSVSFSRLLASAFVWCGHVQSIAMDCSSARIKMEISDDHIEAKWTREFEREDCYCHVLWLSRCLAGSETYKSRMVNENQMHSNAFDVQLSDNDDDTMMIDIRLIEAELHSGGKYENMIAIRWMN